MASLQDFYQRMWELNAVDSQREFSWMFGKGDSWYSTSIARKRAPGLDALVRFHFSLRDLEQRSREAARSEPNPKVAADYIAGADETSEINAEIWKAIEALARDGVAVRP